jgi:hypothetical protein
MLETHNDVLPQSYSRILPRFYSRALPRTFSHALPQFTHGPNHHSYGFGPRENRFEPRRFGYGPRPHHRDTWTVHAFPVVVHISLDQVVRCKGL